MKKRMATVLMFLLCLALFATTSQMWALQIERPDWDCYPDRVLSSSNAGDQNSPVGVSLSAQVYKYAREEGQSSHSDDYVTMNVSMTCNSRRGITYGWNEEPDFTYCPFNLEDCGHNPYVNVIWTQKYNTTSSNPILTNDSGIWVDLPQTTFVFYGIQYSSQVWICTNGFASFDNSNSTSRGSNAFSNTMGSFSPCGERAVIAPLWTQLRFDSQSKILTRYCKHGISDYYFVVIWKNALDSSCQNRLTFALSFLVYDTEYLKSYADLPSGEIWFSYQDVKNITTDYTMGIEDQEGYKGEGYTFSGSTLASEAGRAEYLHSYDSTDLYIKRLTLQF